MNRCRIVFYYNKAQTISIIQYYKKVWITSNLELCIYIFISSLQVWFQNRRAKWKKRKKTTNVFRTPGALLPSPGLSSFGAMNDPLCSFHPSDSRWAAMPGTMNANPLALTASLPRQGQLTQTFGSQVSLNGLTDAMNASLGNNIPMSNGGPSIYNPGYGMQMTSASCSSPLSGNSNSPPLVSAQMTCGVQEIGEAWRGTSIASLRRKALEHTATLSGFR